MQEVYHGRVLLDNHYFCSKSWYYLIHTQSYFLGMVIQVGGGLLVIFQQRLSAIAIYLASNLTVAAEWNPITFSGSVLHSNVESSRWSVPFRSVAASTRRINDIWYEMPGGLFGYIRRLIAKRLWIICDVENTQTEPDFNILIYRHESRFRE